MDHSGADPNLVRRPHCSGATTRAGWQDSTARGQRSSGYTVHFSAAAYRGLTYGLQVIEGLHHAGVEFRSLAEDFDTATANGKLKLAMVLAFSEWWRNSIRERSVAGQAKARAEGRFPGRRPILTEQQREYIREERSRGVSQRELAKRLGLSRWTIQQVDG